MRCRSLHLWAGLLLLAACICLAGCSGDEGPTLRPLSSDAVVLAFGDSLTFGTGAKPEQSYPAQLASLIGRKVIRAGVPGELSKAGLKRLPGLLEKHEPKLVLLCHGGNDLLRKKSVPHATNNLREMVRMIRESGAEVVLLGVPRPSLLLSTAKQYDTVSDELSTVYVRDAIAEILSDRDLKSDTVHPNAAGYKELARIVAEKLQAAGAL
jgi:acyl-CoA thioesterase I